MFSLRNRLVELGIPPISGGSPGDEPEYQEPPYEVTEFTPPAEGELVDERDEREEGDLRDAPPQTNMGPGGPFLNPDIAPQPGTVEDDPSDAAPPDEVPPDEGGFRDSGEHAE